VPLLVNDGVSAILNTNSQPESTSSLGLKLGAAFTVSAKFDLTNPAGTTGYGLGLNDGTSTHSSDQVVQIDVQKSNGNVVVDLFQANLTANTFTLLASQTITPAQLAGNDQILLQLDHVANLTAITGSFELLSGGNVTYTHPFSTTGTIFTGGVTWTRPENFSFAIPATVTISGAAKEGQTLTANAATNDADATIHYQWQRSDDGSFSVGHITPIGTDSSTYVVQESDEGAKIRVVATTSDSDNTSTASATSSATSTVIDKVLAFASAASISGTALEGQTLTAINGTLNDNDAAVTGYQWQSFYGGAWHDITGATSQTYVVSGADETHLIRVVETATDSDGGPSITSTSAATAAVIDETPSITVSISGTPQEGQTLHAVVSGFEDDDTLTYQWQSSSDGGHT
jgi:hypothetical protein